MDGRSKRDPEFVEWTGVLLAGRVEAEPEPEEERRVGVGESPLPLTPSFS